jgi:hypothetical protein
VNRVAKLHSDGGRRGHGSSSLRIVGWLLVLGESGSLGRGWLLFFAIGSELSVCVAGAGLCLGCVGFCLGCVKLCLCCVWIVFGLCWVVCVWVASGCVCVVLCCAGLCWVVFVLLVVLWYDKDRFAVVFGLVVTGGVC